MTVKTAIVLVFASLVSAFVVGGLVGYAGTTYGPESYRRWFEALSLVLGQSFMVIPVLWYLHVKNLPMRFHLRLLPVSRYVLVATLFIAIGLIIWVDELDRLIAIIIPPPDSMLAISAQLYFDGSIVAMILWFTIIVIAPLGEELLFRGFLQQMLEVYWLDITKAVLVTSMVFALVHFNPFWIIQIYLLGLVLGYLSWKTDSIIPGLIVHGLNNALALLITQFIPEDGDTFYAVGGHVSLVWLFLASIALFVGFKLLHQTKEVVR
ncbi:MAG: lysostaphin resistance A-like protein [Fidelibacterota bacterium]